MESEDKQLILLQGPKGVGKSLSLVALAVELYSTNTCTERVLYFNVLTLNSHSAEKYLSKCSCSCEPSKLCTELIQSETRTLLLLRCRKN